MTLFGEINEPDSRTNWEDWDDISDNNEEELKWSLPLDIPESVDELFILEGVYLSNCIKAQSHDFINLINSVPEVNLQLFKIQSENKYIFTIKDYNLLQSGEIVELLKPLIKKSADVITMLTKPMVEYQSCKPTLQSCIARRLTTSIISNKIKNENFSNLEQPNIVSGVTAGVISMREHQNLPALALIFYVEQSHLYAIEEINTHLQHFNIIQSCTNIHKNPIYTSNLYI